MDISPETYTQDAICKTQENQEEEDQLVDASFLLRIGNKIAIKGVIETKFGAKTNDGPSRVYPTQESIP